MIDKRTVRLLSVLAKFCADGSYKIIEKTELTRYGKSQTDLDQMIQFLVDSAQIDVKYSDDVQYCLTVLPKGRVTIEETHGKASGKDPIAAKSMFWLWGGCFIAAMFGAIVGTIIAGIF